MCSDLALQVEGLSKQYLLYCAPQDRLKQFLWRGRKKFYHEVHALSDVSFDVKRGETLGILGANGSGKSTLLQIICNTLTPSAGRVRTHGRISALLELGSGFNPDFTGRENVFLNGAILGLTRQQIQERFDSIAEFAGIGHFIDHPVSTYSSGMVVRLAFAVAVATEPDILVVDEALAVGDEAFQRKCFAHIATLKERGCTLLFVSHSARTIIELCDRALVLDRGQLILDSAPKLAVALYQKLLYAPAQAKHALRQSIAALPRGASTDTANNLLGDDINAQYDPNFKPESTMQFASYGAIIRNPQLTTLEGKPVNQLTRRGHYRFSYDVEFTASARNVRLGMMVRTRTGIQVTGYNTQNDMPPRAVTAGEQWRVSFTFSCLLMPGNYYINCNCRGMPDNSEEDVIMHRILDIYSFQVMPEPGFLSAGTADIMAVSSIESLPTGSNGK